MRFLKIQQLFGAFSEQDKHEFTLFLKSPFFVKGEAEELLRFSQLLLQGQKGGGGSIFEKEELHKHIFPTKPFSHARLERVHTRLIQLIEQFLVVQNYTNTSNSPQHMLDLATVFRTKNIPGLFEKQMLKLSKYVSGNLLESTNYFFIKYKIAYEEYSWACLYNNTNYSLAASNLLEALSLFFYSEQMETLNRFSLQQKMAVFSKTEAVLESEKILAMSDFFEKKSILLKLKKMVWNLFFTIEPKTQNFEKLFLHLKKNENKLSIETLADLYTFIRSYCSYLISLGYVALFDVLHEINKDNLSKGLFYYNKKISGSAFFTIIRTAISTNNLEWAKEFVFTHRYMIRNEGEAEEVYKLALALILFEEKKFEEALSHIHFSFQFNVFFLLARRLELCIYFELQSKLLIYKMEAFRKYLERSKLKSVTSMEWEGNNNFINCLKQIVYTTRYSAKRANRILDRTLTHEIISERRWLREKALEGVKGKIYVSLH